MLTLTVVVPVGSCADVVLPGAHPTEASVGHGRHEWRLPDVWGSAEDTPPVTVRQLVDDERRWGAVVAEAVREGVVSSDEEAARKVGPYLDQSMDVLGMALDWNGHARGEHDLAARLKAIAS